MATKKTNKETKLTTKNAKKSGNVEASKKEKEQKKPLISTKRKVGIAVYFTFLATLALSFGAQIWMMDVLNPPATNEPNQTTERTTQSPNLTEQQEQVSPTTQNNTENDQAAQNNTEIQENSQMEQQDISQNYEFQAPDGQYYPTINL